ncbi:MAG: hypothetical protein HY720_10840 [Planctomycetes bacterium]|nr:hypothetical protein [Planctomycetota bacterium]
MSRIKLHPRVARRILGERRSGNYLGGRNGKLVLPLEKPLAAGPGLPLAAIYVLSAPRKATRTRRVSVRSVSARRALLSIVRSTFNPVVLDRKRLERQFRFAAEVARAVPVRSISYPRTLAILPRVRERILADLAR